MRRTTAAAVSAAALLVATLLAGCSSGGGSTAADARMPGALNPGAASPPQAAPTRAGEAGSEAGTGAGGAGSAAEAAAPVSSTALIKKASLQVTVSGARSGTGPGVSAAERVGRQADAAGQIATAAGGSVFADDRTSGEHASARLTLKVPPDSLSTVLTRLAGLGKEVSRQSSSSDVTSQVADVNSRVASARGSLARLRALYSRAGKVGDIIQIEGQIAQREADLESLEAQQRTLGAQTSMATVELYLSASATAPAAAHHDKRGFLGGLSQGWHSFTTFAAAVATGLGTALPYLVLVLLLAAAGWRLRPRRGAAPPPPVAE